MADLKCLALDLSTRVGWSFGSASHKPVYGVWMLGDGGLGRRCSCLANELEGAIQFFQPDLIILEAPLPAQRQASTHVARIQFGLASVAEMVAYEWNVKCEEERAEIVRKELFGKARVDKDHVLAWARAQGFTPPDHNAADAIALMTHRLNLEAKKR
jgi:Holliday junction resolvasome RuvABC endonuclease subunit